MRRGSEVGRHRVAVVLLTGIVILPFQGVVLLAAPAREAPETQGEDIRRDFFELLDQYAAFASSSPANRELLRSLADSREQLLQVPEAEWVATAPFFETRIRQLLRATREVNNQLQSVTLASASSSIPAFPSAPYPTVNWDFLVEAFGDDEGDVPGGGDDSGGDGGVCTLASSPSPETQFTLLNLTLITEGLRDTASRLCTFFLGVLAGGNGSLFCIITDILFLIERGIYDNIMLCSALVEKAEVKGSYKRLEHLHGDLEVAETSVTTSINTAQTNISTRLMTAETNLLNQIAAATSRLTAEANANEALILDLDSDLMLHDLNLTDRASQISGQIDATTQFILDFQEENLHQLIEENLSTSDVNPIASFQLPEAFDGYLEVVREVVNDLLTEAAGAGLLIRKATRHFQDGDSFFSAQMYKDAYGAYGDAYRAAANSQGGRK